METEDDGSIFITESVFTPDPVEIPDIEDGNWDNQGDMDERNQDANKRFIESARVFEDMG